MNRVSIGSDNDLSPIRRQAFIWTNAGLLSIGPLVAKFSEILIKIQNFSFTKMHLKISSQKWRPFCPGAETLHFGNSKCGLRARDSVYHVQDRVLQCSISVECRMWDFHLTSFMILHLICTFYVLLCLPCVSLVGTCIMSITTMDFVNLVWLELFMIYTHHSQ